MIRIHKVRIVLKKTGLKYKANQYTIEIEFPRNFLFLHSLALYEYMSNPFVLNNIF